MCQAVGHQPAMLFRHTVVGGKRQYKIYRAQPGTLVQQLVEGMLSHGPGTAPQHGSSLVAWRLSSGTDAFAITFHGELLQVVREFSQVIAVG